MYDAPVTASAHSETRFRIHQWRKVKEARLSMAVLTLFTFGIVAGCSGPVSSSIDSSGAGASPGAFSGIPQSPKQAAATTVAANPKKGVGTQRGGQVSSDSDQSLVTSETGASPSAFGGIPRSPTQAATANGRVGSNSDQSLVTSGTGASPGAFSGIPQSPTHAATANVGVNPNDGFVALGGQIVSDRDQLRTESLGRSSAGADDQINASEMPHFGMLAAWILGLAGCSFLRRRYVVK